MTRNGEEVFIFVKVIPVVTPATAATTTTTVQLSLLCMQEAKQAKSSRQRGELATFLAISFCSNFCFSASSSS